jgi:hypothetical protein
MISKDVAEDSNQIDDVDRGDVLVVSTQHWKSFLGWLKRDEFVALNEHTESADPSTLEPP